MDHEYHKSRAPQRGPGTYGASVHNVLDKTSMIPAVGAHIPIFFIGTFDFSKALFYNDLKGGRMT